MSVALLEKQFGWTFFEKLKANQGRIGKGSGQVIDDTASGELSACLAVDYITNDKIAKGAHLALYYPPELLMAPSRWRYLRGGQSRRREEICGLSSWQGSSDTDANEGTLSVRTDVKTPAKFKMPDAADALKRSIKIDYLKMMASKEATIKKFSDTLKGKK